MEAKDYALADWGTTRLRLYVFRRGQLVATLQGPGIAQLSASPTETLRELLAPYLSDVTLEVVIGGMASSRNGLKELAYESAPADLAQWARGAERLHLGSLSILLATGIRCRAAHSGWDVMRGEDAQVFGALTIHAPLADGAHWLVLPGTHSKWVRLQNGMVVEFHTALTGELYALLKEQSILLKASSDEKSSGEEFQPGFASGVESGAHSEASLLFDLFRVRTAQLLEQRSRSWAVGYLSGLLIGLEVAHIKADPSISHVTIIGGTTLNALYEQACRRQGISTLSLDADQCAMEGLNALRQRAG